LTLDFRLYNPIDQMTLSHPISFSHRVGSKPKSGRDFTGYEPESGRDSKSHSDLDIRLYYPIGSLNC